MNQSKSDARAERLRTEANRLYVQKKFYDALLKYNESLCSAEPESENLGLAYANRAAVYFEMKLYDKCLSDIEMAKQSHYPERNADVLKRRETKCLELQRKQDTRSSDAWSYFKLTHPPHEKLRSVAGCLELKVDEKYGRHIVTNRPLRVGDVVAIDEPTFKVVKADSRYSTCFESNTFQRCGNCLNENHLSLIPCSSCSKTMFCSIECRESAQQRHHRFECAIIDELLASGIMHIVVRMFLEGLSLFDDDIRDMEAFLSRHNGPMTIYDFDCANHGEKEKRRRAFLATISLTAVDETIDLDEYESLFAKTKKLDELWSCNEKFMRRVLSRLVQVGTLYVHGIGGWTLKDFTADDADEPRNPSLYQQLLGNGCYLFCSLLNHSCAPNIKRLNVDDKVVVIVSRPIAQGGQLFDSYRPNFNNQPKAQRREALLKDYGFVCDCEACTGDWPVNQDLQVASEELLEFAWTAHEELPFLSADEAKPKLKEYYDIITQQHQHFPSAELIVLQECISNCLIAITKPAVQFP